MDSVEVVGGVVGHGESAAASRRQNGANRQMSHFRGETRRQILESARKSGAANHCRLQTAAKGAELSLDSRKRYNINKYYIRN